MWGKGVSAGVASSLLFIGLNASLNLYTKWLFSPTGGDFPFPWTMLAAQQLESYVVLQAWLVWHDAANSYGWGVESGLRDVSGCSALAQVFAATTLFCLNVGLNSLSLVRISITLNQTVRASLPVGVLLLGTCLERRAYPLQAYMTTFLIVVGIGLTCWGSPGFEALGFCLALVSTIVAALGSSLNGWLLNSAGPFQSKDGGSLGIMRLMMLQSVPAFVMFGSIAMVTEWHLLSGNMEAGSTWRRSEQIALVLVSGVIALLSNLGRCGLVAATGALMETMAGNAKVALLCEVDHVFFGTALSLRNYFGIVVTFTAFSAHVLLQYASKALGESAEGDIELPEDGCSSDDIPEARRCISPSKVPSPGSGYLAVSVNIPRMISGAETGLAAEHMALRQGSRTLLSQRPHLHLPDGIFRTWSFAAITEHGNEDATKCWSSGGMSTRSHFTMSTRSHSWQPGDASPDSPDSELLERITSGTLPQIDETGEMVIPNTSNTI